MKNRIGGLIFIIFLIGCIIGFIKINKWIQGEASDMGKATDSSSVEPAKSPLVKETPKPKRRTGDVIRKTRLAPERTFERSVFYQGGKEIARHKVSKKGIDYDHTGKIPNGKVKFINETDGTYGAAYYWNNVMHGPARTNYNSGKLKIEAEYEYGKLIIRKEYYQDGVLKMEEDFNDAREYMDNRDVGEGKLYGRDGSLKYEWHMINSDPNGYYKSYNRRGKLTSVIYFDKFGNEKPPIKKVTVPIAAPPADIKPQ